MRNIQQVANTALQMVWHQCALLLPRLHPRALPQLLTPNVPHSRLCGFHAICHILLAAILLHGPDRQTLDGNAIKRWLRNLHVRHCWMFTQHELFMRCRCDGVHVFLYGLLYDGDPTSIVVLRRRDTAITCSQQSNGRRCVQSLALEREYAA